MINRSVHYTPGSDKVAEESGMRYMRTRALHLLLTGLLGLAVAGCGGETSTDLQAYVQQVKARQKGRIPPLPQPQEFEVFTYEQASLRDPFTPLDVIEAELSAEQDDENALRPDMAREKDLLEQYKLGSLKMMGTLEKDGQRWALIQTADGTLHRTTAGRYMGQNNGQIISINESDLELREIVPDGLGKWVEKYTTLTTNE